MKRLFSYAFFGLAAAILAGCPIWSDGGGHRVCLDNGVCYSCAGDYYSSDCNALYCNSTYDCPGGTTCRNGTCVSGGSSTGGTPLPEAGSGSNDCSIQGCPSGYVCKLSSGEFQCVVAPSGGPGGKDGGSGGNDSGSAGDSGFSGCTSDTECSAVASGAKCLDGACISPADQCFDSTQCPYSEQCVQGVCTPSCSSTIACPTGYSCDETKGVCTGNPSPCDSTTNCGTGLTCVDQHCVPLCGGGNTCPTGEVCVDQGCIPDQKPVFVCTTEGVQDNCASGSICLHHSCYIACSADAGDGGGCQSADQFNVCKQVTTSTGTYSVCGSSTNLGSDCDPTQGKNCTSPAICIDGYCR
jgi:hypothetical protein